ncbi:MAG TPA: nicotinate-nucleotide adenylyltransferase [Pyrinomonadaceae bacterium]|jgi:nicotinate-nucleotide adenylyltransferase|nr:nicotinate-nucleotide adenylyltransferase [Pyrinomonadaceae bacterium]
MERPKRIALYGGTFDPVHVGHTSVARNLLDLFALDEVLFIPAHVAPHKRQRRVSPAFHRYAMLALATQDEARFRVSTIELDAPEKPYTIETLSRFREALKDSAQLFFVMGADSWMDIRTWREWERVLTLVSSIVVTRPGYDVTTEHVTEAIRGLVTDVRGLKKEAVARILDEARGERIYLTDAARVDVSATAVRRAAQGSETGTTTGLDALVSPAVADYINKYRLYREVHETEFFDAGREQGH